MAQNSKDKHCNDNIFVVSAGGAICAIGGMRDFSFDTRSFMCTALSIQCTWIMTPVLVFKITTFGFQLEIVVVEFWAFASNNYVKSTSSSLCDLRFIQ
jgi:hypothetical protein